MYIVSDGIDASLTRFVVFGEGPMADAIFRRIDFMNDHVSEQLVSASVDDRASRSRSGN